MKPTILEGDRIVVNKMAYDVAVPFTKVRLLETGEPQRGDIVVFLSPTDRKRLVKRIVGLPGDTILLRNQRIYVNGAPAEYDAIDASDGEIDTALHRYLMVDETIDDRTHPIMIDPARPSRPNYGPITVPADHYFMLGDNRDNSMDSRWFGFVPRELIEGRATSVALSVDPGNHFKPRWHRFFSKLR